VKFVNDRLAHDRRYALDSGKLRAELGWQPSYEFSYGLKETIDWYKKNSVWLAEARSGEYQKYFERHYTRGVFRVS
jgi:dTDP-glucose 4,6-dehydratase